MNQTNKEKKQLTVRDLIDKRKELWNKYHDINKDKVYIELAVERAIQTPECRKEIHNQPDLLIELCFTVVDKQGKTRPFFYNKVQQDLVDKIHKYGGKKPIAVLKGRQQGITTLITAIQLCYSIVRRNFAGFTITDKSDNTLAVFQDKAKSVYDRLPDKLKPTEKFNNVRELFFEKLNSSWRTATASENVGRSKTLRFLHLSEVAFFPCSIAKLQESLGETLPADAIQVYETTANGYNEFKDLWDRGVCLNVFYPWWWSDEYRSEDLFLIDEVKDAWLLERIKWLRKQGLEETQIAWYVKKFNNYLNGKDSLRQEYPCFAGEAFLASGECIFNTDALQEQKFNTDAILPKIGYFGYKKTYNNDDTITLSNITFIEDKAGCIRIIQEPKSGTPYVIGGDTAGDGSDKFTLQCIDNITLKQCAVLEQTHMDEDYYSEQAYCLGLMYNTALIGLEVNFSGYPVKHLTRLGYPRQYYRELFDEIVQKRVYKHGFKTNSSTRPQIIAELKAVIRDNVSVLQDSATIDECLTFVKNQAGKPEALAGKHDDLVMALAIAYGIRSQQETMIEKKEEERDVLPFELQENETNNYEWGDWDDE